MKRRALQPSRLSLALFAAFVASAMGCAPSPGAAPDQPAPRTPANVILILIDTLRADRLGAYGSRSGLTPTFDGLAREGVVIERAITPAPWTLPSVASLMTGVYPSVHKASDYKEITGKASENSEAVGKLGDSFETIAELLQQAGYQTAAFVSNPFVVPAHGFKQGFDHFSVIVSRKNSPGSAVNRLVQDWLPLRSASKPAFLYVHYMDTHAPYTSEVALVDPLVRKVAATQQRRLLSEQERKKYRNYFAKSSAAFRRDPLHRSLRPSAEYWQARYDAGVAQADRAVAELRSLLTSAGLWQNALIVLTADHGESLGEREAWGHGMSAHQAQAHVPLILCMPRTIPVGRAPGSPSLIDVAPTLLDYLGLPPQAAHQGQSLRAAISGSAAAPRGALVEAINGDPTLRVLLRGEWKYYAWGDGRTAELYNLAQDMGEARNLAGEHSAVVAEMRAALETVVAANTLRGTDVVAERAAVSEEQRDTLAALGYVGESSGEDEEALEEDGGEPTSRATATQPSGAATTQP